MGKITKQELTDNLKYLLDESSIIDYYNIVYTYDGSDNLTNVAWKDDSNVTLRSDSFAYSSTAENETITQTIVITGGSTIVVATLFDLDGNVISVDRTVT